MGPDWFFFALVLLCCVGAQDQLPCSDAAICQPEHPYSVFEEDWQNVLRRLGTPIEFLPNIRSPCLKHAGIHRTPARPRCLPAFFIGGFPKCGTSSLFAKLSLHPELAPSRYKEPHWWTRSDMGERPFEEYLGYWENPEVIIRQNKLAFEASASTFWDRGDRNRRLNNMLLPEAMSHIIPQTKMIVLVRDPAERAWSEYKFFVGGTSDRVSSVTADGFHNDVTRALHLWRECRNIHPLLMCIYDARVNAAMPRLNVGLYGAFVEQWRRFFPAEQLLVISTEQFAKRPRRVYEVIFSFLNVDTPSASTWDDILNLGNLNVNMRDAEIEPHAKTMQLLRDFYRPFNEKFTLMMRAANLTHHLIETYQ